MTLRRFWPCALVASLACTAPQQGFVPAADVAADGGPVFDATGDGAADTLTDATSPADTPADAPADTLADTLADTAADVAVDDTAADSAGATDTTSDDTLDASDTSGATECFGATELCSTSFSLAGDGSEQSVEVRGSWDAWKAGTQLSWDGSAWTGSMPLEKGATFQYKFRIVTSDGKEVWQPDPANPAQVDDGFGGKNSVLGQVACATWTCAPLQTVCGVPAKKNPFDWRDGVLYFVFVDRFHNGDPTNDKKASASGLSDIVNWHGGDWKGVTDKIQAGYFQDLGINALWLTVPMDNTDAVEVGEDGKLYTAYHGYWPRDVTKTNPRFGTMAELKALVDAAHAKGMQVILDYAMNHLHSDSPTFQAHKDDGWFHPLLVGGQECVCGSGACPWDGPSGLFCWFRNYLPDFDMSQPAARKASIDNVIWWLQQTGADGLRLDAIKHVEGEWLTELRQRLLAEVEPQKGQHVYLVGETFSGDQPYVKSFVDPCTKLDGQFDFALRTELVSKILLRQGKMPDVAGFLDGNDKLLGDAPIMSTFVGNHDLPRSIHLAQDTPLWGDPWASGKDKAWSGQPPTVGGNSAYERLLVAQAILWTNRGVPLLYYGDEIGLAGAGDPDNRRPMPWSGYDPGQSWLLEKMKKLGQARLKHAALRRGTRTTIFVSQDAWVYRLDHKGQQVYVALSRGDQAQKVGGLPSQALTDELSGEVVTGPEIELPPRSVRILPVP